MNNTLRSRVKKLYKECFDDTDEFVELYFNFRFNQRVNVSFDSGDQTIAAMQMLPYSFTYQDAELPLWYISGACTHPDYRNMGVMQRLIAEAFARMSRAGVVLSALIPANDHLFDYYEKTGFSAAFYQEYDDVTISTPVKVDNKIEKIVEFRPEVYEYYNQRIHKRDCCVQHSEADFKVIVEDMKIDNGFILVASREGNIVGTAFVYCEDQTYYIAELLADTEKVKQQLIEAVQHQNTTYTVKLNTPSVLKNQANKYGMIRIINAGKILQLYAVKHPTLILDISLNDSLLSSNSKYYYLYKGRCMISEERLPGKHLELDMKGLAELVFKDENFFMSLMMD